MKANPRIARGKASHARGVRAEWLAMAWLLCKGYRIIARRHRTYAGEVDIIARKGRVLAAVEVKARTRRETAAFSLSPAQAQRIVQAMAAFQQKHPRYAGLDVRCDIILIAPLRLPEHSMGAWMQERV